MNANTIYNQYKAHNLKGRYITLEKVESVLKDSNLNQCKSVLGFSVNQKPIPSYRLGCGSVKILIWSQMHGNESTTTKALVDFMLFLDSDCELASEWKSHFTFLIFPILNPDGAENYTRVNANGVDLNRDFINLSQPESRLLYNTFMNFKPDFCFNLHDQRTIFGVGDSGKPATISFLAPSFDENRSINGVRQKAINLISGIAELLQNELPNQIGRFEDGFNRNCVGDTFQQLGVPTVLFEAGHYQEDYAREKTRMYVGLSLFYSFSILYENDIVINKTSYYLKIPQNNICFFDIVYRNAKINYDNSKIITNFAAQYKEVLKNGDIHLEAYISSLGDLKGYFGHIEYDLEGQMIVNHPNDFPKIDEKVDFELENDKVFVNGLLKN